MKYLLDTSVCVGILRGKAPKTKARLDEVGESSVLCSIVHFELQVGVLKSLRPEEEKRKVRNFTSQFASLKFDVKCALHAAAIRAELEAMGRPMTSEDIMIAGIAKRNGLIVVTQNVKDYARISGLTVEN